MTEQLHDIVEQTIAQGVGARVFPLRWKGRRIWIKQAVRPKQKGWHRLQRFVATLTRIPMLRPTVSPGGKAGLASEAEVLHALNRAGVLVPDLLEVADNWIAIGDNGAILQTVISDAVKAGDEARVAELIAMAGTALADLHANGFAHGAPLLRNMTIRDDGRIGFIDFEEDPNKRMPLPDAQARDILLFVFSIQRGFKRRPDLLRSGWQAYLSRSGMTAPQMKPLSRIVAVIRPVYIALKPFRRWLGTDAINAMRAYGTLRRSLRGKETPQDGSQLAR
ncbi:hypothetical protein [Thalassospira xiamenensis]|uniref:hypothetical protein n=1 Tax=Thalassospira xiamenensis TaxID=220697 RepID=UPI000DEDCFF4|nr:hypothetical protein [Thalassospira xiamenensis]RCK34848.1 hypothetical protein TH24_19835 [Thalassospira xiamenensis]